MAKRGTLSFYIDKLNKTHPNFEYVSYDNETKMLTFICKKHNKNTCNIYTFLNSKFGCKQCWQDSKKLTFDQFLAKTNPKKFTYLKDTYINYTTPMQIICKKHGIFESTPQNHLKLSNGGCPACYSQGNLKTQLNALQFKFPQFTYTSLVNSVLTFECKTHGTQTKNYNSFINSVHGCSKCAGFNRTISEAQQAFDAKKFNLSVLSINKNFVTVKCNKHNEIFTKGFNKILLSTGGCYKCNQTSVSQAEQEWLSSLNLNLKYQHRIEIGNELFVVDGYDQQTNTIYEYYGDFFHGNPDVFNCCDVNPISKVTYGELYNKTIKRSQKLKQAGYTLVERWESDCN